MVWLDGVRIAVHQPMTTNQRLLDQDVRLRKGTATDNTIAKLRKLIVMQIVLGMVFVPAFIALTITILSHEHEDVVLVTQYVLVVALGTILSLMSINGFAFLVRSHRAIQKSAEGERACVNALLDSERNLRALLNNTGLAFILYDTHMQMLAWNAVTEVEADNLGIRKPYVGMNIQEWGHTPTNNAVEHIRELLLAGKTYSASYDVKNHTTNQWYSLETHYNPVRGDDGTVIAICCVIKDVTEQRLAEQEARHSEEIMRQIAESVNELFFVRDWKTRKYIYVSSAYERIFQRPVQALLDDPEDYLKLMHPDDFEQVRRAQEEFQKNPKFYSVEYRIILPDGNIRWIWSRSFCVFDKEGNILRTVGIAEDVTRFKEAEKQAVELALERQRMHLLSSFIRSISHEFRNPLATIHSGLFLLRRTEDSEERNLRIDRIEEQAQNILRLVEDMVTMTRLDTEKLVRAEPVDLRYVLEAAVESVQEGLLDKHLTLTTNFMPDIPMLNGDFDQLRRLFVSLLSNGVRYTPDSGAITVTAHAQEHSVMITIHDTGIGIAESDIPRIWELFYRVDQARTTSGFGLGLSVAKRIVELHGGSIDVRSRLGEGSTFIVQLPFTQSESSPIAQQKTIS